MNNWISVLGILLAGGSLFLTWVKLKPSERRLAKRISSRAWRAFTTFAMLTFFLWSNYYFLSSPTPVTRFQVLMLVIVYAEMMALGIMFVVGRLIDRIISVQERVTRTLDKSVEALEQKSQGLDVQSENAFVKSAQLKAPLAHDF